MRFFEKEIGKMKVRSLWILLFSFFVLTLPAAAFEPPSIAVHPKLQGLYESFFPGKVLRATDGVYVTRGYNRDNPVLIEGVDGLIIIDPGESKNAAEIVKSAFNAHLENIFDRKPVKAIIYTHHHDCHIHGASVFANTETEIIAHENLMTTLFYDWYSQLYPSRLEGGVKMSGNLFAKDPGWYAGCGLFATQIPGDSGFLPPTKTVNDTLEINIAGVNISLFSTPGETRDILLVWLPDKKTLIQIGNFYQAFPAITTIRGAYPRDPLSYISSLDFYRSLNPEYMVLCHGPNPVMVGKDNINRTLTNYRDAIQFVHDQTVQYMNKGLTPGEIQALVKLPPHLVDDPFLQEVYGAVDRNIYEIFWWYRGYFSGKCRDLFPQSPLQKAEMARDLAGGVNFLAAKAKDALDDGKLEWALELADDVLLLDSGNADARATKNAAIILLAEETMNAQTRNYLLSEYLLETGQAQLPIIGKPKLAFAHMDENAVRLMPMDTLFRIMAVSLNASKSLEKDMIAGLFLLDIVSSAAPSYSYYTLNVRRGILEVKEATMFSGEFIIFTDPVVWKKLVLGKLDPQTAVSDGDVYLYQLNPEDFCDFMDLFN